MYISRLRLRNFRNFRNAEFRFTEGVNTLIGENGSGKTNAFYAIRMMLDESLPRLAFRLRESDFNRSSNSWKGRWIIISIDFEKLDTSEGCQVLRHNVGHMNTANRGTYTFYFRPNRAVRKSLFEATQTGDATQVQRVLDEINLDQYEPVTTGRSTADFLDEAVYAQIAGDFGTLSFPNPDDDDLVLLGSGLANSIHAEVSCTFVKALRDVIADLRNYRDSPLLNLLRGTERKIEVADTQSILTKIKSLNDDISSLQEIRNIAQGVQDSLHETVGHTYSPTIDIQSAIPEEMERLLQRLCLNVSDPGDEGYMGEIDELSLGGANLIYLSLKLLEYEMKAASDRVAHFLLIEEPESHIHTHVQKTLFEKYSYDNTQVIVSTHSTHISAASRIRSVNILSKGQREAQVFHPSNGLEDLQCQRVERYLDAVRSTLLFAKGIVLVEGDAELILIPTLIKKVFGVSLDELGVSLISMSSTVFANIAMLFDARRINRHCAILTDFDASIVTLPADSKTDTDFEKDCRASAKSGAERKIALDEACKGNSWVKPFYAPHTFEVEFLQAGNINDVVSALNDIYKVQKYRDESTASLKDSDIGVSGKEILRLAQKEGKGWLAVILAEHVSERTVIPQYVLEAVAFACRSTLERKTLSQVARHRCEKFHPAGTSRQAIMALIEQKKTSREICDAYKSHFQSDILTAFIALLG